MNALIGSVHNGTGKNGSGSNSAPRTPQASTTTSQQSATTAANSQAGMTEEAVKMMQYAYSNKIGDDICNLMGTGKAPVELANFVVAVMAKDSSLQQEIYSTYSRKYSKKPVKKFIDPSKTPIRKIYDNYDDAEKAGVATPLKVWLYAEPENGVYERITDQDKLDKLEGKK